MFRITPGTLIIGILAVLFGLIGAVEMRRRMTPVIGTTIGPVKEAEQRFAVPYAVLDLDPDRVIAVTDYSMRVYASQQAMDNASLPVPHMRNPNQIVGRMLRRRVARGSVFQPDDFYPENIGPNLADRLRDTGRTAVAVEVESVGMLAGHAVPGTKVDVIFRTQDRINGLPLQTATLLSNVEVLAVGETTAPGAKTGFKGDKKNVVTLAVPHEKSRRLKTVEGRGVVSLAIRDPSDPSAEDDDIPPETLEGILKLPPNVGPFVAEIYRRGVRQTVTFSRNQVEKELFGKPLNGAPAGGLGIPPAPLPEVKPAAPQPDAPSQDASEATDVSF